MKLDRDTFLKYWDKYELNTLFEDVVNGAKFTELEDYVIYYDQEFETVSIINKYSLCAGEPIIISWYKYMHPGRSLNLVGIKTELCLENNLKKLAKNMRGKLNA